VFKLLIALSVAVASSQPAGEVSATMAEWSRALGVQCSHCHVEGDFASPAKPTFAFAQRMSKMVRGLSDGRLNSFGGITCWTCHRGATRPARLPRESWERIAHRESAVFVGPYEKRSLAMSVYSASLGVDCSHCHERGDWMKASKSAHAIARTMVGLFDELPTYFAPERMPSFQCYLCHQGAVTPQR
jgi:Photosynthetic reaction centre cytochrome C subunit